jgi:hypothetical protein
MASFAVYCFVGLAFWGLVWAVLRMDTDENTEPDEIATAGIVALIVAVIVFARLAIGSTGPKYVRTISVGLVVVVFGLG